MTDLITIPGVGKSIRQDLLEIGVTCVEDLRGQDPQELYARCNAQKGAVQDRCLLYVFRCAVHYATIDPNPALKWWDFQDKPSTGGIPE